MGVGRNLFNRRSLVALLAKELERSGMQPCTLGNTALLQRSRWKRLPYKKIGACDHAGAATDRPNGNTPTSAPAQQTSIQPPKTPAISGAMLGKRSRKKA